MAEKMMKQDGLAGSLIPALAIALGLFLTDPAPGAETESPEPFAVRPVRDIAYVEGDGADPERHKLDLYLPREAKDFPVLFFVHGGAWLRGDKNFFGVYPAFGALFARHGIGAVVINYRLSPRVRHPEHIRDVACAFAWTHRHIADYGGRPDRIFLCGHSAGGHLVSLLATDERYLKSHGLGLNAIRGVVPLSGVFRIPPDILPSVFGTDLEVRRLASPLTHVRPNLPPFLIFYAEKDFPTCGEVSEEFCRALKEKNVPATVQQVKDRTHGTIMLSAVLDQDPVARAILKFIADGCREP